MKRELCIKQIYDDFVYKVLLTDIEKDVLIRYIKDESIVKIASELCMGTATVSRIIAEIKDKYKKYKELELVKLNIFK